MSIRSQMLIDLLKLLTQNNVYEKAIQQASKKYKIKHFRVEKLKPSNVKILLNKSLKKDRIAGDEQTNYSWAQGGLKIFIWFLIGYVYLKKVDIIDLDHSDFQYLSSIFKDYSVDFLCYQSKFLLKTQQKVAWTDDQVLLLKSIIKQKFHQKNWNTVAYELFMDSNKTVFKTPKQCRERWLNHEDPVKIRSDWTSQQDIQLLKLVKSSGKRWSQISRLMGSTRTEHMVKNRFTSLIRKASKKYNCLLQTAIIKKMLSQTKNSIEMNCQTSIQPVAQMQAEKIIEPQICLQLKQIQDQVDYLNTINCHKKQTDMQAQLPMNLILENFNIEESIALPNSEQKNFDFFQKQSNFLNFQSLNFLDFFTERDQ